MRDHYRTKAAELHAGARNQMNWGGGIRQLS